jgi:hypothetical protein
MDEGEFDAFSITRENGEVIEIRHPQEPPPWSGDRRKMSTDERRSRNKNSIKIGN